MKKLPDFKNKKLLEEAFTHRSYLNEAREKIRSNERLEFLGDSILTYLVSEHLFKKFPDYNEGILTNLRSLLVNTKSLAGIAKSLGFGEKLKLSRGEEESKGRENQTLLANSFEAYVGALFLDQGLDGVSKFIEAVLLPKADDFENMETFKDPKSLLQELVQARRQGSPVYRVLEEEGPAHKKIFTIGAYVDEKLVGKGKGNSKQEGEEKAASDALEKLGKK